METLRMVEVTFSRKCGKHDCKLSHFNNYKLYLGYFVAYRIKLSLAPIGIVTRDSRELLTDVNSSNCRVGCYLLL
jgi:hypothetical protein